MMLAAQGVEKKSTELFESLRVLASAKSKSPEDDNELMAHASKMKSSGFLARLQAAAAVNNSDWKLDD